MELKPCPFCGSETVCAALLDIPYDPRRCYVLCQQCGARGPVFNGHEKVAVVEAAWNSRAVPAPGDRESHGAFIDDPIREGPPMDLFKRACDWIENIDIQYGPSPHSLAALLAQVRAEERERCERVAESLYGKTYWDDPVAGIAAAIRRGEP